VERSVRVGVRLRAKEHTRRISSSARRTGRQDGSEYVFRTRRRAHRITATGFQRIQDFRTVVRSGLRSTVKRTLVRNANNNGPVATIDATTRGRSGSPRGGR